MAENWSKLELQGITEPLEAVTTGVKTVTGAITTALNIQKGMLEIIATFILDFLNLEALLIKTALQALQSVLDTFVKDAKIHLLVVPICKQPAVKLPSLFQMPSQDDSWTISDEMSDEAKQQFENAMQRVAIADQGNEGYARTVIESLEDLGDLNRPDYGEEAAIYGVVCLAGAKSMINLLELLQALQRILGTSLKGNKMIPPTLVTAPQDLKVTVVASPSTPRVGAFLEWGNPDPLQTMADFGGCYVRAQEIAIVRSTDDKAMLATDWSSFFISQPAELGEDDEDKSNVLSSLDDQSTLIKQFKFTGNRNSYIDDDSTLEKNKDYYYTVAFRYAVADPGQEKYYTQDYYKISNVVKARVTEEIPSTRGGVHPDWISHPSVLGLIPDLQFYFKLLSTYIASLIPQTEGAKAAIESYIKFLAAEIQRYNDFQQELVGRIEKLVKMLQLPSAGVYVTTIELSSGGNQAFTNELAQRLTDASDTSAPPFFGNGMTAGFVLLAGASNPAELEPVKALVSLLFGGSGAHTPFENAVNSIDRLLAETESKLFSDDMQPSTETTEPTISQMTFDDNMNPVEASSADANVPWDP